MVVPFLLSILLLLCQHGSGFRFRSTASVGQGTISANPKTNIPCSQYNRDCLSRGTDPYNRGGTRKSEFNCSTNDGLPCDEVYALRAVISELGLPSPSISRSYCSQSDDKSISITCNCDETTTICHITAVVTYSLSLSGHIHEDLSKLIYLNKIELSKNFLKESIPASLGNLINLTTLDLSYNMLSGQIPTELGNLLNLTSLRLQENQLSGNLPRDLGNLNKLPRFYLNSNNLTGELPESFANLTSLLSFNVAGNKLRGKIPPFVANWTKLNYLNLMGNDFEGELPLGILNMSSLRFLWVSDLTNSGFSFPKFTNLTNMNSL
ncbi:unnamed protein product [Dovyalis caffra]|uniref:Uncharacterized protein n=1 Tax=Dovyalis caffra TaxID=77055 RepID=A0AAV1S4M6_9ROSI|nr:unnamed protein product [Dovyalis caffra]